MTREEQLACLIDRPCAVCKFYNGGCSEWKCVFEEEPESADLCKDCDYKKWLKGEIEPQESEDYISRKALLAEIDKERDWLLNHNMCAAEHIVVHHARRIIEDMRGTERSDKE